jgi:hypothetical protein
MRARNLNPTISASICAAVLGLLLFLMPTQALASSPGPTVAQVSVSEVASTSATLSAAIDPDGTSTSYYFEYGTDTSYGTSVPAPPGVSVGSGEQSLDVDVHLQGLTPNTVYHYRVVASSAPEGKLVTVASADQTFTTQFAGGEFLLPDGREWEMVSPPQKHGAGLWGIGLEWGADIQAAADGDAITYAANNPIVTEPAGARPPENAQILSARIAPGAWESQDIATPHDEGAAEIGTGHRSEYKLFSSDLSLGLVEPIGVTPLPPLPAGSEKTIYLRAANGEYKALVSAENVPPGTEFGGPYTGIARIGFAGATPDLGHVAIESEVDLTSTQTPGGGGLYEWSSGQLQLVSVLPGGEPSEGSLGAVNSQQTRHAISDDGSRLIWNRANRLYLRDTATQETIQIDAAQGAPEPNAGASNYQTADDEGSRVFFTSSERLTANSTAPGDESKEGSPEDLYEFEVTSGSGQPLAGRLTDLTVDANAGETAAVQGVIGASESGTDVYFVADGVLGDGAEHGATSGDCGKAATQSCNLYVEHYDEATGEWMSPTFIDTLSGADWPSWGGDVSSPTALYTTTSRVSPNGSYLAFMSQRSLTGYENSDANSGESDEEVFLYDASANRVVCASCDPSGARPVGTYEEYEFPGTLVDSAGVWNGRWFAANIPGWTNNELIQAKYQSRYLSNSGRLFFNSADALVPDDVNGQQDVYEYEPAGVGSCQGSSYGQSASVVFDQRADGCVGLISAGTSPEESAFLDASESGGDVFFLTPSRLTAQDDDDSFDVYDAHECTASSPCAPAAALTPPPCTTGDGCKPAPTPQPQIFGEPSSATFTGAGNVVPVVSTPVVTHRAAGSPAKLAQALKACRVKRARKRTRCERQATKRYGPKHTQARKSSPTATRRSKLGGER